MGNKQPNTEKMTSCRFELCVYNEDEMCQLSEGPTINEIGACEDAIAVSIDSESLKLIKQEMRDRFDAEDLPIDRT